MIVNALKSIGGPGSGGFFAVVAVIACLLVLRERTRPVALVSLTALIVVYLVLSLPIVANALADRFGTFRPLPVEAYAGRPSTLVVFGGDNSYGRDREARRLVTALQPARVMVLGDDGIARSIAGLGIPADRVTNDRGAATTTRDQVERVAASCRSSDPIVVVASRLQMPRIEALARARHLGIVPAAAEVDEPLPRGGSRQWAPSAAALRVSRDAIYEEVACLYYRWNGWTE